MTSVSFKKTADVVVIGGGCNGTSTALHLAKRGVKNVVLVEKNSLASGATEDSIGNARADGAIKESAVVRIKSLEIFENFNQEIGGNAGYMRTGRIWAVTEENKKMIEAFVSSHQQWGSKIRLISLEEIKELLPQVNLEGVGAAAYIEAGNCDPVATTLAYATRARELGVTIYEETEVTDIRVSGGRIQSVVTNQGEISTPVVVNVAGLWSDRIGRMVGVEIPIIIERQQNIILKRPYDFPGIFPIFHDASTERGYKPNRPWDKQLIQVYKTIMVPPEIVDPDNYNDDADTEFVTKALEHAYHRFPVLSRASIRGGLTGCYDMTPDDSPILGAVPEVEGFYCNCGWSGQGFQTSAVIGDLIAELITTGRTTLIDTSIYRLSRFKEGKAIESSPWGRIEETH